MSEKWPPRSFQTSKPLGNMTALESQEAATKEVDIASLVCAIALCVRERESSWPGWTASEANREWEI